MPNNAYIPADGVTFERLDEEILAIHLGSGLYYSMVGTAADCWDGLVAGITVEIIANTLGRLAESEDAEGEVRSFVATLVEEKLVIPDQGQRAGSPTWTPMSMYTPPILERFGDLQDLLLIDPIHDVSEQGWPRRTGG